LGVAVSKEKTLDLSKTSLVEDMAGSKEKIRQAEGRRGSGCISDFEYFERREG